MSLTVVTNPVSGTETIFAGFQPIEFEFKREDLAIDDVASGAGTKAQINLSTDLTSYLSVGDSLYLYSEGSTYTYDTTATITAITSGDITLDIDYIESGTGGYINYLKNYYVEMVLVNKSNSAINILDFNLTSDGTPSGVVTIDVSIANDLNTRNYTISNRQMTEAVVEFEVKYREVHLGVSNSYTLIDNKLLILAHAIDAPSENSILNPFDLPKIYMGYDNPIVLSKQTHPAASEVTLSYTEQNINQVDGASADIATLDADFGGLYMFVWDSGTGVASNTKFVNFEYNISTAFDFLSGDFASPDFVVS